MPLIPLRPLLETVDKYHFAQGAFNVNAVAQAKAAIEVHEMFRSAAILQGADLANGFMGGRTDFLNATLEDKKIGAKNIANAVKKFAEDSPIPVVLHLDHGKNFDSCKAAIEGGYTSVMIDGSSLPFDENVELVKEVVSLAKNQDVAVEAEIGSMGSIDTNGLKKGTNTTLEDCVNFVTETGIDSVAASVGTVHGIYKGELNIDYKLIKSLADELLVPLVLHGGSGLSNETLKKCVESGITKININSDIQESWSLEVKKYLQENPDVIDPRKIIGSGKEAIKSVVASKININN